MTPEQIHEMHEHPTHAAALAELREEIIAIRALLRSVVDDDLPHGRPPKGDRARARVAEAVTRMTTALSLAGARTRRDHGLDR